MVTGTGSTLLALTAALAVLVTAGGRTDSAMHAIGRHDARELKSRIRKDASLRNAAIESATGRLASDTMVGDPEAAIRRRLLEELDGYIDALQGRRFVSVDAAFEAVQRRERILCFDLQSWPAGFASGRMLTFVVDESDAEALRDRVPELVLSRELALRSTVRALVQQHEIVPQDARALRDMTRGRAEAAGRAAVEEIRGGAFFSKADAELFVENALAAVIDGVQARVESPEQRQAIVDEARTVFGIAPGGG